MTKYVALLRGINVGGHRKVPMAKLRAVAAEAGFAAVQTYVASRNVVLESDLDREAVEAVLEETIKRGFGFQVDVVVRSGEQWAAYGSA